MKLVREFEISLPFQVMIVLLTIIILAVEIDFQFIICEIDFIVLYKTTATYDASLQ